MALKKRGAVYSVIALMLCVAVYLNWSYNKKDDENYSAASATEDAKILGEAKLVDASGATNGDKTAAATKGTDYFSTARLSRQQARDEAVTIFNATVDNANATATAKDEATNAIQKLAQNAVSESRIENLVIAKGYKECVVFINDTGVNVIVPKTENGLKDSDVAKIKDLVISETTFSAANIKIIEAQ